MTRWDNYGMPKTNTTILRNVEYPLHVRLTLGTDIAEIEFFEEGRYSVNIKINK